MFVSQCRDLASASASAAPPSEPRGAGPCEAVLGCAREPKTAVPGGVSECLGAVPCAGPLTARPSCHAGVPAEQRSAMSVPGRWVLVWAAWAYSHTFLLCHAVAEPKAAVFGGVPIIDEKGKGRKCRFNSPT